MNSGKNIRNKVQNTFGCFLSRPHITWFSNKCSYSDTPWTLPIPLCLSFYAITKRY